MFVDGNSTVMPVQPMYGGGYGNGDGVVDGWWIILLLLAMNGWGNNNGFGGGNGGAGAIWPYFTAQNTDSQVRAGFDTAALTGQLSAIQAGQASAEVAACGRATSQLERSFATQTAITDAISNLAGQQAQCCCENRLATCQTQNVIQREGSDTRYANAMNTRDITDTINNKVQMVMDKLCQLELDGVKAQVAQKDEIIAQLRGEALYARGEASRLAQSDQIVDNIYNRLNNCPVGTTPVYGRTPIFTCNQNNGCGCNGSF